MTPIRVRLGQNPTAPRAIDLGQGFILVTAVAERWQIEVGWWRVAPERPVRRDCWRVMLEDGRCLDLRQDRESGGWSMERNWG
ncbi:MAG TPA: DUF6504 family protein [Candidatus Dormibacteraeota bacterium]